MQPRNIDNQTRVDAWERWAWVWYTAFYAMLTLTTVLVLTDGEATAQTKIWSAVLTALLGLWFTATLVWFGGWEKRIFLKVLYVAGAMTFWFLLVGFHPIYWMLLFVVYGQVYHLLPMRWAVPSALAVTVLATARVIVSAPGSSPFPFLLQGLIWAAFGTGMSLWIYSIINQSHKRQNLIVELENTRAELANEERRSGMLEERSRLAREIHDTLAQGFISIVTHLEAAEDALSFDEETGQKHLNQARRTARESLVEARRLVRALQPELLESSSLPEALERLAQRWSESSGVSADVLVAGDAEQLPQELQVTLFRVAQEALSNAQKHAGASRVDLTLSYIDDLVVMDVQDDGVGFDPTLTANGSEGGFGLRAMRERVQQVDGKLLVESAPGEGTTLAVELPVRVPVEEQELP